MREAKLTIRLGGQIPRPLVPRGLVAVAAVALMLKAALLWLAFPLLLGESTLNFGMFPDEYDQIALSLSQGHGYRMSADMAPTMMRTPGYVLVLATLFYLFGKSLFAVQLANVVFSTLAAGIVYATGRRLLRTNRLALAAAIAVALHPIVIVSDSRGGPESLMLLGVAAMLWLGERLGRRLAMRDFVLVGLVHGVGMLVKSSMALMLPALCIWLFIHHRRSRTDWTRIAAGTMLAGAVSLACQAPWIVRNYVVSGHFVPTMTVSAIAAFQGQYVVAHRNSGRQHARLLDEAADRQVLLVEQMGLKARGYFFQRFSSTDQELQFHEALSQEVWERYRKEPFLIAEAIVFNALAFWVQGQTESATRGHALVALPLLVLAICGAAVHLRRSEVQLALLLLAAYLAPHLIYMSVARYQAPVIPLVALLAAAVLLRPKARGSPDTAGPS